MNRRQMPDKGTVRNEPWLATYADMVTLLMCFFVLLFSMSQVEEAKFRTALVSLQEAFGIAQPRSTSPGDTSGSRDEIGKITMEFRRLESMAAALQQALEEDNLKDKVSIHLEERGVVLRFLDSVIFDIGKAEIEPRALEVITVVAKHLQTCENQIRVEGHTDNWPIETSLYPSNWELSTGRATNVVRFFEENCNIPGERLQASGFGQHRPIDTNETSLGRQNNRRIDVIVLNTSLSGYEPKPEAGKAGAGL